MSVCVIVFLIGVFIAHALKVCVYLPLCDYDLCYFTRETRSGIAVFFSFEILEAERKVSTQPSSTLTDFDTDIDNTT